MKAEFDTVAAWTAEVAADLGPDYYLPAGCRGSGSPGALRWLLDRLAVRPGDRMLDAGAGVGGPAAFAAAEAGVRPVLSDPEAGACRAAQRLFDLPVVQAGSRLPFASGSFDVVWCLGVLCTVPDQELLLRELGRVLAPGGRLGLLVFVASRPLPEQPVGNDFAAAPPFWDERAAAVEAELERRYGDDPDWQVAERQSGIIGRLLQSDALTGTLIVAS